MVFGRSSNQGNSSNINLLYSLRNGNIYFGDCVFEWIEVADDVVDLIDVLLGKILFIGC